MFWTNYERYCKMINKSPNPVGVILNMVGRDTPEPIRLVRVCKTHLRRYAR